MIPTSPFQIYDEVLVKSQDKYGIVISYYYHESEDMFLYHIDCEDKILECRENDLRLA